ncbi:MAG TPA: RlmE family RNA methyltransferase [Oligoflexia bacterium]|nr:RlmE family RNA methyltransferase [Oligoflexia bacterium]HMP26876.1 RlmE family RNA methyltransferase [Oligoflexia bacterium]
MVEYKRKDRFYQKARAGGYRSRAYFKLAELDLSYKILPKNQKPLKILDLGAWPGSWIEYLLSKVALNTLIMGVDLVRIDPFDDQRVKLFQGDIADLLRDESDLSRAIGKDFDLVLSDLSPKLTGIAEQDRTLAKELAESAGKIANRRLKAGGNFVCKLFKSEESAKLSKEFSKQYVKFFRAELESTRKTSNEFYFVGLGLK